MTLLQVRSIRKSFGNLDILNDLGFEMEEGELRSVIGPNGAGKTTLFNVITGRYLPDEGSVFFKGKEVTREKPHTRARMGMARSFQINNFFPNLTTFENVHLSVQSGVKHCTSIWRKLPGDGESRKKALDILDWLELGHVREEAAANLSYGDQRKLEIALALGTGPSLLLLDEPTSGMSRYESGIMVELIKKISEKVSILLIEHDIDLVMKVSDSITVIHYGKKIAEGKPEEITRNEEVQRVYLGGL